MNITHNMNEYLLNKTQEQLKSEKMSDDRFLSGKYTWYANKYGIKKKFTEE